MNKQETSSSASSSGDL